MCWEMIPHTITHPPPASPVGIRQDGAVLSYMFTPNSDPTPPFFLAFYTLSIVEPTIHYILILFYFLL